MNADNEKQQKGTHSENLVTSTGSHMNNTQETQPEANRQLGNVVHKKQEWTS